MEILTGTLRPRTEVDEIFENEEQERPCSTSPGTWPPALPVPSSRPAEEPTHDKAGHSVLDFWVRG